MSNRIKELRLAQGWSMEALAQAANTTKSQISKLEKGERRLSQEWMERLALALGCAPADFLPGGAAQAAPGSVSLNIADAVDSSMGGWVRELGEGAHYTVMFRPPVHYQGRSFIGLTVEGSHHAEFPEGTDLVFASVADSGELENGKLVLLEEEVDGKTYRSVGQVEVTPQMITINFNGSDHRYHHRKVYWSAAQEAGMLAEGGGRAPFFAGGVPELPAVPLRSGHMRIVGVLAKSMKNE